VATAVIRFVVDAEGALSAERFVEAVRALESEGYTVVASAPERLPDRRREVEIIVEDDGGLDTRTPFDACARAFGTQPELGVITYVSRGTDDDARGVLQRFGIGGNVDREVLDGSDEVVTVTIARSDMRRVPESRLHTALEAALNCDVRIVLAG
jgi:hypothetical protein